MALVFKKAQREQVRIKVSIAGPAGSGKTMSSLLMAYGLATTDDDAESLTVTNSKKSKKAKSLLQH